MGDILLASTAFLAALAEYPDARKAVLEALENARGHQSAPLPIERTHVRVGDPLIPHGPTKTYELIGEGKLEAVKAGRTTLITMASLERYLANLPLAQIRTRPRLGPHAAKVATPDPLAQKGCARRKRRAAS